MISKKTNIQSSLKPSFNSSYALIPKESHSNNLAFLKKSLKRISNLSVFYKDVNPDHLSSCSKLVLGLGINFIPVPKVSADSITTDLLASANKLQCNISTSLLYAFDKDNNNNNNNPIPRIKSKFPVLATIKPDALSDCLEQYHNGISEFITSYQFITKDNRLHNIINNEIRLLKDNNNIVIKPADKGLGTVVMSTSYYNDLCLKHINDITTYKPINNTFDYNKDAYNKLKALLCLHDKYNYYNFFSKSFNPHPLRLSLLQLEDSIVYPGKFYCLPKLHKATVSGRPIVNLTNTVTYYPSLYLHNLLNKLVQRLITTCLSSTDVLRYLHDASPIFNADSVILCADVTSLYPSIPLEFGMMAVETILKDHVHLPKSEYIESDIPFILDLLRWCLTNSYIEFDKEIYLQIFGTAMGSPIAVCYANLTMYYLERNIICLTGVIKYFRYIDDILSFCNSALTATTLCQSFNQQCPSIQLDSSSITIGRTGIFLDITATLDNNNNCNTDIFQKTLNKYLYIPPVSNHSPSVFKNLIVSEIRRYRLLCSSEDKFLSVVAMFKQRLLARGYSSIMMKPLFANLPARTTVLANLLDRNDTRSNTIKKSKNPLITIRIPPLLTPLPLCETLRLPEEISTNKLFIRAYNNNCKVIIGKRNYPSMFRLLSPRRFAFNNSSDNNL
jgi:hypothetical protein